MTTNRIAIALLALACACKDDDDKDGTSSTSSTTGTAWLVGDDAEMLRVSAAGEVSPYDVAADHDFHAIACQGTSVAWVAGAAGTLLVTRDAGLTWADVDVGTGADLTAIAVSEHGGTVWVVGNDGTAMVSRDDGSSWAPLAGAGLDWSGVATDHAGDSAILVALDGSIWRATDELASVREGDGDVLHGVSVDAEGRTAAAVGDLGTVLLSKDAGASFEPVGVPTTRDLHAVRVSSQGNEVVAVGEAGVVVRIDELGATAHEELDPSLSLRALHLRATGLGQAVGDAGVVLLTQDAGLSWSPIDVGSDATLRGVDDFHVGPHP